MTIDFKCLHCGTELAFTDDQADQRIDCESCGKPIVDLTTAGWIVMAIAATVSLGTGFYIAVSMSFAGVQPKVVAGAGLLSSFALLALVYLGSRAALGACGISLDGSSKSTLRIIIDYLKTNRE